MSTAQSPIDVTQRSTVAEMPFSPQPHGYALLQPATAASMVWKSDALLPATAVTLMTPPSSAETLSETLETLSMTALANRVFPESRSMENWEKQVTDDFYLSHFH